MIIVKKMHHGTACLIVVIEFTMRGLEIISMKRESQERFEQECLLHIVLPTCDTKIEELPVVWPRLHCTKLWIQIPVHDSFLLAFNLGIAYGSMDGLKIRLGLEAY